MNDPAKRLAMLDSKAKEPEARTCHPARATRLAPVGSDGKELRATRSQGSGKEGAR